MKKKEKEMNKSRTKTVFLNSSVTLFSQIIQVILGFVVRKIFIDSLGVSYLGYNSVFSNILQMLNLADLGIGVAITSFLFKPIADGDKKRVATLMYIYKKVYMLMGAIVFAVGIVISIFLGIIVPDATCSLGYLRVLFFINLAGTVSTYFLAYKRTLIIADQKSYITNLVDMSMFMIISVAQIMVLLTTPNYILYLILQVTKNVVANIILSICSNKQYGKLSSQIDNTLIDEYKPRIIQYVKDVFVSRIGATIFYGTDNVIISIFRGSILAGYLSNYTMITSQLTMLINQILSSLQATFGNYIHSGKTLEEQRTMTSNYFCVNYCMGNFCMICFALLAQPFVRIFFGTTMTLTFSTAMWLGINMMLTILIQLPSQIFVIYKLFKYDRPIIITSAILNIILSVSLVRVLGINGVLIGTFVTSLIYLFSRFYIIAKYVYDIPYLNYVMKILNYFVISGISFCIIRFTCRGFNGETIPSFIVRLIFVGFLSILIPAIFLSFTKEFRFLVDKILPLQIAKVFYNKIIIIVPVILMVMTISFVGDKLNKDTNEISEFNKSLNRTETYQSENNGNKKIFNLTFDDTIDCFEDISNNNYQSIFDNTTFSWVKSLHDKYGVVVTFYVYYENEDFNLKRCSDRYKKEFEKNSDWLRFGFHTLNGNISYEAGSIVDDYSKTVAELKRIVGSSSIDNVIRLQKFQGSYDGVKKLLAIEDEPVIGLLTADDDRQSYYLNNDDNKYVYCHDILYKDSCYFISTDLRMEYVKNVEKKIEEFSTASWNNQMNDLVVFSHEWALDMEVKEKIEKICKYAKQEDYEFLFFEDEIVDK